MASNTGSGTDSVQSPTPSTPVDLDDVTTSSIEALQSEGQRKILDVVDQLRRQGLDSIIELPQLVVCGDQSSGKSSVLEAITEIPFPRKENLCTRFATEIILRRNASSSISITITPDKGRSTEEQDELSSFQRTITDFKQLPDIMEEATKEMGLNEVGQNHNRAFARDVLSIEICGPQRPQLTLVDLPGLIHSSNKMQSDEDVKLIRELVLEYMSNPRTIILAVISARNDYANQIILKHCRDIDPQGQRTLGIITKPDSLQEGSTNQQTWLDLSQNRDVYFELGWHMVKNRSSEENNFTFQQRNESERRFFNNGRYREISDKDKGVGSLCERLSTLLQVHLKRELPHLKAEITTKCNIVVEQLKQLGIKRSTPQEQRMFLTEISMKVMDILKAGVNGHYETPFFGKVDMDAAVDSPENLRRFRAVIQYLNLQFSREMRLFGHKYAIPKRASNEEADESDEQDESESNGSDDSDDSNKSNRSSDTDNPEDADWYAEPKSMTRDEAVTWVRDLMVRSRGRELPGSFNPMIIGNLFEEQSTPWEGLALHHIRKVFDSCKDFVNLVIQDVAPPDIRNQLSDLCVDVALEQCLEAAKEELSKVIVDKKRPPMTYNHYFTTKIQDQRKSKYIDILSVAAKEAHVPRTVERGRITEAYIDSNKLENQLKYGIEQNMDNFAAEDALDSQIAFYADELKYFIDCTTKQVIERHLVSPLTNRIISPTLVSGMSDEQVHSIAAEPSEVFHRRNYLEERKKVLDQGLKIFREAMGGFRR